MSNSGEKTEKATPKKRKEQRDKGNILKSQDLSSALILVCVFGGFKIMGGYITTNMSTFVESMLLLDKPATHLALTPEYAQFTFVRTVISALYIILPLFGIVVVSTTAIQLAQTRFLFTAKTLEIKFDKLNPINGFKRIFSHKSIAELIKSIFKIAIIMYILYAEIVSAAKISPHLLALDLKSAMEFMFNTSLNIALKCSIVLVLLSVLDLFYQWWSHEKELKMTKQEVKEEYKNTEGNPQIKGKIAQKQREMSAARMMEAVPNADVVITNPTHYAVALKYNSKIDKAPIIIAMGKDFLAKKIKEKAKISNVIAVENVPLARALYAKGEIGKSIPVELYRAVAGVLSYVSKVKSGK